MQHRRTVKGHHDSMLVSSWRECSTCQSCSICLEPFTNLGVLHQLLVGLWPELCDLHVLPSRVLSMMKQQLPRTTDIKDLVWCLMHHSQAQQAERMVST